MGTIMMGIVVIGMVLSVYHLMAEILARGRRAARRASRNQVLHELYSRQPAVASEATSTTTAA